MTIFDYIVLLVLVCSVLISTSRGLIKEMLSLVSWVIAFVVANAYGGQLANLLPAVVPGAALRLMLAFVLLFIGVRILMGLLTMALAAAVTASGLGLADRGLGSLFGVARGMCIVLIGVALCGLTEIPRQSFWKNALLSPLAETGVRSVKPYLPSAYARYVRF